MSVKYRLRRFAVGEGVSIGKRHVNGRDRLVYRGPKGGTFYIGTRSVTTSRKKRLVVQYFRSYISRGESNGEESTVPL